jgi:hypothetical protein
MTEISIDVKPGTVAEKVEARTALVFKRKEPCFFCDRRARIVHAFVSVHFPEGPGERKVAMFHTLPLCRKHSHDPALAAAKIQLCREAHELRPTASFQN